MIGLAAGRRGWYVPPAVLVIAGVMVIASARHKRYLALMSVLFLGLLLGAWRGATFAERLAPYRDLYGQKVVLHVTANEDAAYAKNSQLSFEAVKAQVIEPYAADLPGRIKVSGFGTPMVYDGDVVKVEGKLRKMLGGRQGQVSFAQLEVIERRGTITDAFRRNFAAGMQNALPEPAASFGMGILVGQRSTLPEGTAAALATVGLTHVIAVSGYNLTIIVEAVRRLSGKRSKYQSALLAAVLIALFLLMTGMSASIVRAAIVSGLSILAWYYGRKHKPILLIALAACLTAGWNPLYIWSDIGWYLSFLAFFGVLVIAPLLAKRLYGSREPGFLTAILLETLSAQIMTLPLILYIFQQVSLVSILSNLLVVPLIPVAMLLALIAGLAGMWLPVFAGWFAWPANLLLTYILDIAALLAKVPNALSKHVISLPAMVGLYAAIILSVAVMWRKVRYAEALAKSREYSDRV